MRLEMTRRNLMFLMGAAGLYYYVGGWWFIKARKGDAENIIVAILKKNLDYLKLNDEDLKTFALVHQEKLEAKKRSLASWAGMLAPVYSHVDIFQVIPSDLVPGAESFQNLEEKTTAQFLLSTDFFLNGADESKPVKYLGYYDPLVRRCQNPFAVSWP